MLCDLDTLAESADRVWLWAELDMLLLGICRLDVLFCGPAELGFACAMILEQMNEINYYVVHFNLECDCRE